MKGGKQFLALFSLLYSLESMSNCVIPLFCGYFFVQYGTDKCLLVLVLMMTLGQILFAIGLEIENWGLMLFGRFVFGIGGENMDVAISAVVSDWFVSSELEVAFGFLLCFEHAGTMLTVLASPRMNVNFTAWFPVILDAIAIAVSVYIIYDQQRIMTQSVNDRCQEVLNMEDNEDVSALEKQIQNLPKFYRKQLHQSVNQVMQKRKNVTQEQLASHIQHLQNLIVAGTLTVGGANPADSDSDSDSDSDDSEVFILDSSAHTLCAKDQENRPSQDSEDNDSDHVVERNVYDGAAEDSKESLIDAVIARMERDIADDVLVPDDPEQFQEYLSQIGHEEEIRLLSDISTKSKGTSDRKAAPKTPSNSNSNSIYSNNSQKNRSCSPSTPYSIDVRSPLSPDHSQIGSEGPKTMNLAVNKVAPAPDSSEVEVRRSRPAMLLSKDKVAPLHADKQSHEAVSDPDTTVHETKEIIAYDNHDDDDQVGFYLTLTFTLTPTLTPTLTGSILFKRIKKLKDASLDDHSIFPSGLRYSIFV